MTTWAFDAGLPEPDPILFTGPQKPDFVYIILTRCHQNDDGVQGWHLEGMEHRRAIPSTGRPQMLVTACSGGTYCNTRNSVTKLLSVAAACIS